MLIGSDANELTDELTNAVGAVGSVLNFAMIEQMTMVVDLLQLRLSAGGKLLFMGNGGSAADAYHIAGEFIGRYRRNREPIPAIALASQLAAVTAIANDFGYEHSFARMIRGLACPGDVVVGISTSGKSANILEGVEAAVGMNDVAVVGVTGRSGAEYMEPYCDELLVMPSDDTPHIQECYMVCWHAICGQIETILCRELDLGVSRGNEYDTD